MAERVAALGGELEAGRRGMGFAVVALASAARGETLTAPIRVLVVDDDVPTRVGVTTILASEPGIEVVGEAADGHEACDLARTLAPDVVLMDVQLPGIDGIEATRRITAAGDGAPRVLVLTTFDVDEYVVGSVEAGASGFLLKRARGGADRRGRAARGRWRGAPDPGQDGRADRRRESAAFLVRRAVRAAAHRP